ncbi:MAG: 2-amino-4-hydroxy-6-hydroxymethyldihydropteridine diphosphokinase [Planctomycetota bacterium]|nr:2-amino-4-hydroxy-6-hydroxymethyldihydropteridine diphosphokinase [Planctomycetota bacterium]
MARVVAAIALGSNLGDREKFLRRAMTALERTPGVVVLRRSTWHETAPVGGPEGQDPFLNGACLIETTLGPADLLARLHEIEAANERLREVVNGPRTLDLDLLLHGETRSDAPGLTLPHPRMEERAFVLAPLAEIAVDLVLASGKTVGERLAELEAVEPN